MPKSPPVSPDRLLLRPPGAWSCQSGRREQLPQERQRGGDGPRPHRAWEGGVHWLSQIKPSTLCFKHKCSWLKKRRPSREGQQMTRKRPEPRAGVVLMGHARQAAGGVLCAVPGRVLPGTAMEPSTRRAGSAAQADTLLGRPRAHPRMQAPGSGARLPDIGLPQTGIGQSRGPRGCGRR